MEKPFHKVISTSMAFLVLLSTFSFVVDMHYCGSILVDKAVFSKAETCGMAMHSGIEGLTEDSCCTNEQIAVEGQDELKVNFEKLDLQQQVFLTSFTYSYINLFEGVPQATEPYRDYSPPLLVTDIQLLDQVFLI
jgi:hypothetical protein